MGACGGVDMGVKWQACAHGYVAGWSGGWAGVRGDGGSVSGM